MKRCHECDAQLVEDAAFCPTCGRAVIELPGEGGSKAPAPVHQDPMVTQVGMPVPHRLLQRSDPETPSATPIEPVPCVDAVSAVAIEPANSERRTIVQMAGFRDESMPPDEVDTSSQEDGDSHKEWSAEPPEMMSHSDADWSLQASLINDSAPNPEPRLDGDDALEVASAEFQVTPEGGGGLRRLLFALGGVFVLLGILGGGVALLGGGAPLSLGEPQATVTNGLMYVRLPMRARRPIDVTHPGGEVHFEGEKTIRFSLPANKPKFEPVPLPVTVREGETPIPISVVVEPVYRLRTISVTESRLEVQLTHKFGWKASVKPGRLHRIDSTSFRWVLDLRQPKFRGLSMIPASVSLVDLKGAVRTFDEALKVPSVVTPLNLVAPAAHHVTTWSKVSVEGFTLPGALVTVESQSTIADVTGHFELEVPLVGTGRQQLSLTCKAEGRQAVTHQISVSRQAKQTERRRVDTLRAAQAAEGKQLGKQPPYADLGTKMVGKRFPFRGRLVSLDRIDDSTSRAVIALCDTDHHCPVLAQVSGPAVAVVGQRVRGIGRSLGLRQYRSRDNHTRNVPRIEVEYIVQ